MTIPSFPPTRRDLLAGTAGLAAAGLAGVPARSQERTPPSETGLVSRGGWFQIAEKPLILAANAPAVQAVVFPLIGWRFRNETFNLPIRNDLANAVTLDLGALLQPQADPLAGLVRLAPGETFNRQVTLKSAGTHVHDLRMTVGDQPMPVSAAVVQDNKDPPVDSDLLLLIEDFRQAADGTLLVPGRPGTVAKTTFTINREPTQDIAVRTNQRLRLRFVNGCQRQPVAIKIEDHDVTVVAIDGQPCEPFPARGGQLILAPGNRIDVMVDALKAPSTKTAILLHDGQSPRPIAHFVYGATPARADRPGPATPVASNGLPERLDLKSALRSEIAIGPASGSPTTAEWSEFAAFEAKRPVPAFTVKRGRTVVLALTNRSDIPATFRLHGHHFRLLDRLDDGWKPFWLDRLLLNAGETHRIAFQPNDAGGFFLEAMAADWSAPKLIRWFRVE